MKSFTTILLTAVLSTTSLATTTTSSSSSSSSSSSNLDNHTIVQMTYTGPITPGGNHVSFTGDNVQDIHSQIKALNPDFELAEDSSTSPVSKRKDTKGDEICNIPGRLSDTAQTYWIRSGIKYLKGLEGKCGNEEELQVKCSTLADYANDIIEKCDGGEYVNGQEFDDGNWNVVVAGTLC
ncbi:hypothetical protein BO78DRAFT_436794 [Aspergillus sclerotiicarbonarius CBS 121057]|uniref:Ecp2 effector protein domain-containing protein n=1 Tax=Aspergillus sclerotiicarbonarius (strain CBS 121057 / IBT 28362) TaxID=1448318 RepID=A0A319EHN9_ASPSB|nr:hypothetical protein BO78DRAFT_436794 [Aspergillus sclerotiicarbonarius CBS 121057]